ncbi:MAG: hypothetical protein ACE5GA_00565 [Candidatus Zixiibacteriota bacterium]
MKPAKRPHTALIKILIGLCAVFFFERSSAAQLDGWRTFGVVDDVRFMDTVGGEAWALTSGGILVVNPSTLTSRILTNTDGLLTNDFEHLIVDAAGDLWIAGLGRLVKRPAGAQVFEAFAFLDQNSASVRLHAVADDQTQLWVGADIGLTLFDKVTDGGQIQDSYQRFGSIPAQTAVVDLLLTTDSIWVATPAGLAVGERTDPLQLKSFANWAAFTSTNLPSLFGLEVTTVRSFSGEIIVGTSNGAFSLSYSPVDSTITSLGLPPGAHIFEMRNDLFGPQTLTLFTSLGRYVYDGASAVLQPTVGVSGASITTGANTGSAEFVAAAGQGVFSSSGANFSAVQSSSLPGPDVRDIALTASGVPFAAFWIDRFAHLSVSQWLAFDTVFPREAFSVTSDSAGALWLGTFGSGLWRYDGASFVRYDTLNSTLTGNTDPNGENFVVIYELVSGPRYTYVANYRALNLNPVSIVDQTDPARWISFGAAEGVNNEFIVSVDVDGNRLVLGSENSGAYLCDLGPDPFDKSDYVVRRFFEGAASPLMRISSDKINVARFDPQGNMWLGHTTGLMRFDAGIERFVDVELPLNLGPGVVDIEFGPQDNIWLATFTGLGLFNPTSGTFQVFTALNSGLVSDNVRALSFDPATNFIWSATDNGISRFLPALGIPNFDVQTVSAFPNPFRIQTGADRLRFNFSGLAEARIFTESGELVWIGPSAQGWPGLNQSGEPAASGVYIYLLSEDNGATGSGKILLIRD